MGEEKNQRGGQQAARFTLLIVGVSDALWRVPGRWAQGAKLEITTCFVTAAAGGIKGSSSGQAKGAAETLPRQNAPAMGFYNHVTPIASGGALGRPRVISLVQATSILTQNIALAASNSTKKLACVAASRLPLLFINF